MGTNKFLDENVDYDEKRMDRENRTKAPEYAFGQGDNTNDLEAFFSSDFETSATGFEVASGSENNQSITGGNPLFQTTQQQDIQGGNGLPNTDMEDKVLGILKNFFVGCYQFLKDFNRSFFELTPKFYSLYGKNVTFVGAGVFVFGLISLIFRFGFAVDFMLTGFISIGVGVLLLTFNMERALEYTSEYKDGGVVENIPDDEKNVLVSNESKDFDFAEQSGGFTEDILGGNNSDFSFNDDIENGSNESYYSDDIGYDNSVNYDNFEDESDDFNFDIVPEVKVEEKVTTEDALNSMVEIDRGTYTRQYLYETFTKVLPHIKPDFATEKKISEDDNLFIACSEKLRDACRVIGVKEEDLPELLELSETLMTIRLVFERKKGLKPEVIADELGKIYAYDEKTHKTDESVYAIGVGVGMKCIVTIFTGQSVTVSLKDMYMQVKEHILDSSVYIPVVIGIDSLGEVKWADFKKVESVIVAGQPRTGKSWLVQSILTQMCAYLSPNELNIYILDPKDGTSDFSGFVLPHVKGFATRYENSLGDITNPNGNDILETLRNIVHKEAPRRKKLLGDAGCKNIWDYKKKYPDVHLPLLYLVIDEAVTLAEDFNAEDKKEYLSYVTQLITQFPNLGVRAILLPHVVKNEIIKKTATDSVKCRISVKGDANHIESSTGTKPKDFKYKLSNTGDLALKMDEISPSTMFVKAGVLTSSNGENDELFEYLRRVWGKLEPDVTKENELVRKAEVKEFNQQLIESLDLEKDEIDLFEDDCAIDIESKEDNEQGFTLDDFR